MKDFFAVLRSYLKRHITLLVAFALTGVIFASVFSLYSLETEAVLYACLITAAVLLLLGVARFSVYYKKHRVLCALRDKIDFDADGFPPSGSILEDDYAEIVSILAQSKRDAVSLADMRYRDMLDYYTMWAHQIKNPIAAMRLVLQGETSEYGDELEEQLFRIEEYVEMVLQYLRTENISSDLAIGEIDLDALVCGAVKKYRRQFIRRHISVKLDVLNVKVLTDEKWFSFVLEQIISNALKYTREGGSVSIYCKSGSLVVEDNGVGIRAEDLPRIFEKGFTGFNGRADKKSTGIGLYLCKKILTRLSHPIAAESVLGHGTKIIIGIERQSLEFQ